MRLPLFLCALWLALPARAATVDLSAAAERPLANDQIVAVVFTEETGSTPDVARRVNERIAQALATIRKQPGIRVQTQGTHSSPLLGKTRRIEGWRVRSALRLEGSDAAALADLLGRLQGEMAVESVSAQPSRAARAEAEKGLIGDAIAAFREKAEVVAKALGGRYQIKSLTVSGGDAPPPRPMMAMRAMAMEAAPMPIEAGESQVGVVVSGQIEVSP